MRVFFRRIFFAILAIALAAPFLFYGWEWRSIRLGNALLPHLTYQELLQRAREGEAEILLKFPLPGSSPPYRAALTLAPKLEDAIRRDPVTAIRLADEMSAAFTRQYRLAIPLFPLARIEAVRRCARSEGNKLLASLQYQSDAEALAHTPLGLDPAIEEEFLPFKWQDTHLPPPTLRDGTTFDPGSTGAEILLAGGAPLTPGETAALDAALPGRWAFLLVTTAETTPDPPAHTTVLRLDTRAPEASAAVQRPAAQLDLVPYSFAGEREHVQARLAEYAKIREDRRRRYGSPANWVWAELTAHRFLLLNPAGRLISYSENADETIRAAIDWLTN